MFVVLWELAEILWTLGKNGPLYSLLSAYKGAHKISSIYWVYGLYKGFIKLYQKLSISLMAHLVSYNLLTASTLPSTSIFFLANIDLSENAEPSVWTATNLLRITAITVYAYQ